MTPGHGSGPGPEVDPEHGPDDERDREAGVDLRAFVPRRGRTVSLAFAASSLVLFAVLTTLLPGPGEGGPWTLPNRLMFFAVGAAIAALLWRYATIVAVPDSIGLRVRNLFLTRHIPWADVSAVKFGTGDPWVSLELHDADTVAVMAIQKADGPTARGEAQRLATLVDRLGGAASRR